MSVRFNKSQEREAVRSVVKLRGTTIYANKVICRASQAIRKEQLPLLKQARCEGNVAYFTHTRLVVKERNAARRDNLDLREAALSLHETSGVAAGAATGSVTPRFGADDGFAGVLAVALGDAAAVTTQAYFYKFPLTCMAFHRVFSLTRATELCPVFCYYFYLLSLVCVS